MTSANDKEALLKEAKGRCAILAQCLPKRINATNISVKAKLPFKALWRREGLLWRVEDLARCSCAMYERSDLASAITLTRACMESVAAMDYLYIKLQKVVDTEKLGDIDGYLMRLLGGGKMDIAPYEAINVNTFIDYLERKTPGFREIYDQMSEYAHPNSQGTTYLYSKPDQEKLWVDFARDIRGDDIKVYGLSTLNSLLATFEDSYNKVGELMPAFVEICENSLGK